MANKAVICPVCHGTGKVKKFTEGTASGSFKVDCHGCGGKGWVEVSDDSTPYVPYYPTYPNYPDDPYYPTFPINPTYPSYPINPIPYSPVFTCWEEEN